MNFVDCGKTSIDNSLLKNIIRTIELKINQKNARRIFNQANK